MLISFAGQDIEIGAVEIKDADSDLRAQVTVEGLQVFTTQALPAGENHIGQVGAFTASINGAFTRPNDANVYASGDVVTDSTVAPTVITFVDCARVAGGTGVILKALMVDSANQATLGEFELWLFDTTFAPDNDNAPWTPTEAELATLVDVIPLPSANAYIGDATAGAGGNVVFRSDSVEAGFDCPAASRDLYGIVVVRNAYTPVANEEFTIILEILQD